MKEVEAQRLKNKASAAAAVAVTVSDPVEEASRKFKVTSPDGSCNLSFSANTSSAANAPFASQDLPQEELGKIDGPARIEGGELQVSVHNGSGWDVKEITVGLTLVRASDNKIANFGRARLITASAEEIVNPQEKSADVTLLYHLKGDAAPLATVQFRGPLSGTVDPEQEWHWAILQAKGALTAFFRNPVLPHFLLNSSVLLAKLTHTMHLRRNNYFRAFRMAPPVH